jgi:hypothetical protein
MFTHYFTKLKYCCCILIPLFSIVSLLLPIFANV